MQQIEIEMVGAETSQARLASTRDAPSRQLVGLHLGDQEYTVALTGKHATNQFLGAAVAVISRRIDQRHPERNAYAQRLFFNSWRMPSQSEMRGALTERRDGSAVWKLYGTRSRLGRRACGKNPCTCLHRSH